eukprot:gene38950-48096_t
MHTYYIYSLKSFTTVFYRGIDMVLNVLPEEISTNDKDLHLSLDSLDFPWDSLENLTEYMLGNAPGSKAKSRYLDMVYLLTSHETLT